MPFLDATVAARFAWKPNRPNTFTEAPSFRVLRDTPALCFTGFVVVIIVVSLFCGSPVTAGQLVVVEIG
ncbi:hypothetical protein ACFYO1_02630 [Nocardia sp. NPDC006044]|uniref:hypothetical protein n=1 Tax=Nocardia sp. NPDC006044 TaxID=3364306 RepID=UPI0036C8F66E